MTATSIPAFGDVINDQPLFAEMFLRILDKYKRLVPLRYNRPQQHYLANRTRKDIVLKARQFGMSTAIQSMIFKRAVTETIGSLTLAHDDDSTQALRRISERFYDEFPEPFPKPLRELSNATITTYPGTGSEVITATAGKKTAGRSLTITLAHLSEVAFWNNADTVMTGLLQAIPTHGEIIVESTPNGQSGWFYERCMEAYRGEGSWKLHFYPWWWGDDYALSLDAPGEIIFTEEEYQLMRVNKIVLTPQQIKWRRVKMIEMGDEFAQEYPEDIQTCFLSTDGTSVFRNVRDVATAKVYADAVAYRKAHPNARFVMGVDWGRDADYSVFTVMDVTRWHVVAVHRVRHLDWHIQRARLKAMCHEWQCERIFAEKNSIGDVNISALLQDNLPVQGFTTTERSKKMLIDNLALALEEKDIRLLPDSDPVGKVMIAELTAYQQRKKPSGNYEYEGKPHDDCVMSLALALFAVKQSGTYS